MIPYEQLVEAISRWKTAGPAGEDGADLSQELTSGEPAESLVPDEVVEADAVMTEEAEEEVAEVVDEVVETDPE